MSTQDPFERAKMLMGRSPLPQPPMKATMYEDEDCLPEYWVKDATGHVFCSSFSKTIAEKQAERFGRLYQGRTTTPNPQRS